MNASKALSVALPSLDDAFLRQYHESRNPQTMRKILRRLLEFFFTLSPERITAIELGIRNQDAAQIKRAAHSFRNLAGNVGAARLTEYCRHLEELSDNPDLRESQIIFRELMAEYPRVWEALKRRYPKLAP